MTAGNDRHQPPGTSESTSGVTRRGLLLAGLGLPLVAALPRPARAAVPALTVHARTEWAGRLGPTGPLDVERAVDVRYLLVHHTASSNAYRADQVPAQLQSFYRFHTSGEKGWPDIAYNFLVDRYGGVWEGRTGSLDGPVKGSATGGSQGFDQLACYIGDLNAAPATVQARASMLALLAMLAERYHIDTAPGAQAAFTSRGSNRWPAGTAVVTQTIAGHRDMSLTTCPGDLAYADVRSHYPAEVTSLRSAGRPATSVAPPSAETSSGPGSQPSPGRSTAAPSRPAPTTTPDASPAAGGAGGGTGTWVSAGALTAAAATASLAVARRRRRP